MDIQVQLMQDDDGFLSQECPSCGERFKTTSALVMANAQRHCPYCGHEGEQCWWTQAQADYLGEVAANATIRPEMEKMAKRFNRPGSALSMKLSPRGPDPRPPAELDEPWLIFTSPCCKEPVRFDGERDEMACVRCGKRSPTEGNISKGTIT